MKTKTKTAAQIQAEIDLIRLAYRDRQLRDDASARQLFRFTLLEASPYLLCGSIAAGAIAYLVTLANS